MQLHSELDLQAGQTETAASSSRKRDRLVTRKVTVRLTEKLHEQLVAATDRPGVGKSMVVEAALQRFLEPDRPVEDATRDRFGEMNARFDRLEYDIRILAETVALHARYHFSIMPSLPQTQQREACVRGDERFKVLAEQVDQRVRMGRPLMQETIDRLNAAQVEESTPSVREGAPPPIREPEPPSHKAPSEGAAEIQHDPSAAAGEGGSNSNFRHLPNSFCWPA